MRGLGNHLTPKSGSKLPNTSELRRIHNRPHPVVAAFLMLASSMTVLALVNRKITPQLPGSSA
ncbi:hypothetical protein [Roseibacillus persicicus]|uniref:hypothetical protein n=1 Tax=Roseibacillus persicicus TaxID=454148 RepID=UPI0036704B7D